MKSNLKHAILGLLAIGVLACYCQYKSENTPGNTPGVISKAVAQVKDWLPEHKNVEDVELACIYQKDVPKVQRDLDKINENPMVVKTFGETKMMPCILKDNATLADIQAESMKMLHFNESELVGSLRIYVTNDYQKGGFFKKNLERGYPVVTVKALTRKSVQG